jgi:hypothetical protein
MNTPTHNNKKPRHAMCEANDNPDAQHVSRRMILAAIV